MVTRRRRGQPPDRSGRAGRRAGRAHARARRRRGGRFLGVVPPGQHSCPGLRNTMNAVHSWPGLLGQLIKGETLGAAAAAWAMNEIMEGAATPAQIAGFGIALRMKGEAP